MSVATAWPGITWLLISTLSVLVWPVWQLEVTPRRAKAGRAVYDVGLRQYSAVRLLETSQ